MMPWSMPIWRQERPGLERERLDRRRAPTTTSSSAPVRAQHPAQGDAGSASCRWRELRRSRARPCSGSSASSFSTPACSSARDAGERQPAARVAGAELRRRSRPPPPPAAAAAAMPPPRHRHPRRARRVGDSPTSASSSRPSPRRRRLVPRRVLRRPRASRRRRRPPRSGRGSRRSAARSASSSAWVPSATTRPSSSTATRSARLMVDSRWAMISVVRSVHQRRRARRGSAARSARRWPTWRRRARGSAGSPAACGRWRCAGAGRPTACSPRSPTTVS